MAFVAGGVSFIVSSFGRKDLLQRCVTSLTRTIPPREDVELIVVDDASTLPFWVSRRVGRCASCGSNSPARSPRLICSKRSNIEASIGTCFIKSPRSIGPTGSPALAAPSCNLRIGWN